MVSRLQRKLAEVATPLSPAREAFPSYFDDEPYSPVTPTVPGSIEAFIQKMPKAELHVHLEGTLEPNLVRRLAERNRMDVPEAVTAMEKENYKDLPSFLKVYYEAMSVLKTEDDFFDLTFSYLLKCKKQHIVITEMFFDPQAHTGRGVPFTHVIEGIKRAISRGKRQLGVRASLIMCFLRDHSPEWAMATLMESLPHRKWITGIGLDSDEQGNPPNKFAKVFQRATREGFMTTAHCDVDQEDSIEHIRQALLELHVDRLDHGTNIVEDPKLVQHVKEHDIGLTCCPISNDVVASDSKIKEIKKLLDMGVRVTVNSDDPAYFKGYLNENMLKLYDNGNGLTKDELLQLQVNAFMASWTPSDTLNQWLGQLEDYRWEAIG